MGAVWIALLAALAVGAPGVLGQAVGGIDSVPVPAVPTTWITNINVTLTAPDGTTSGALQRAFVEPSHSLVYQGALGGDEPWSLATNVKECTSADYSKVTHKCNISCIQGAPCSQSNDDHVHAGCGCSTLNVFRALAMATYVGPCGGQAVGGSLFRVSRSFHDDSVTTNTVIDYCFRGDTPIYLEETLSTSDSGDHVSRVLHSADTMPSHIFAQFYNWSPTASPVGTFDLPSFCKCPKPW